jgi:hypothetical protein
MDERMTVVREQIAALRAEADAERLAHRPTQNDREGAASGRSLRQRAGQALVRFGTSLEGQVDDCDGCPEGAPA